MVTHVDSKSDMSRADVRLRAFDRLAGSVSMDMIDSDDPRTQYLLSK